jgi:glycosyltransferase involved in cell wall biosynthesis
MLIHVNKNYFAREKTGKGKFAARLVNSWREMGIKITEDPKEKADIALHIGRMNYESKARKHVLRVGPACINNNMNWKKINHEKAQSVKKADAVIYQSRYSKKIYHNLVCKSNKPETVIFNGADPRDYDVEPFDSHFKNNFLASTRVWLKQKRLKTIIQSFLEIESDENRLIVCGDTQGIDKKYNGHNNILFTGPVSDEVLSGFYKACNVMIHITWIDACPNSVVEALVAGLPVICTDQGGTHELLEIDNTIYNACTVLRHDSKFKYKPVNLDKPPQSDELIWMLSVAMKRYAHELFGLNAKYLHIENIAKQYLKYFEKIL